AGADENSLPRKSAWAWTWGSTLPPKKETVGTCRSSSASSCGRAELGRRGCMRPDRGTGRDNGLNIRLIHDRAMKRLQKEKRAQPPRPRTLIVRPAGARSAGAPYARRKDLAGHPQTQRGDTGEDQGTFSPTGRRPAGSGPTGACQDA